MKLTGFILISFLLINKINGQCDSQFFRYTGSLINDVSLIDTSRMIAVGDNGYIIKSGDGGKSWKNIKSNNNALLKALQLLPDSTGYTVGSGKTILKTIDQGESWFPLYANIASLFPGSSPELTDLYFFNKDRGHIVGNDGLFLSTNDGGKSWNNILRISSERINSVTFISDSIGFICGTSSSLYKTVNGGRTWQKITITGVNSQTFLKIRFIDNSTGFILGYSGLCLKTTDGGTTWTKINTPSSGAFFDIYFQNSLNGIIVGNNFEGLILQTENGGNTWNVVFNYPGRWASYYSINADPAKQKIIIAGGGSANEPLGYNGRNILSSIDSGTTYTPLSRNGRSQYNDLFFLNDSTGFITGEDGIVLKTSDYGESWKSLQNIPALYSSIQARRIFFLDSVHGFASTDNIYKTSNGGLTWTRTTTPDGQPQYFTIQMYFFDSLKGLVQNSGTIYKTINAGLTWTNTASSSSFYRDFTATPDGKVFAVGHNGKLDISTNEGTTWVPFNLNTTKYLTSVYFYSSNIGFIGTRDSCIFKTMDGGLTWTSINTGISFLQMLAFHFINESTGYMMCNNDGGSSWIYKTIDGGLTWIVVLTQSENISRIDGFKTLYSVGGEGLILKTDTLSKPGFPGYIYGPVKACVNDKSSFITGTIPDVNYNWSLSNGGTNVFNANKDTVTWNSSGMYTLSVTVSNACGVSPANFITTDVIVFQPVITVLDSILTATEGLTYQWFRNGAAIATAQGGTNRSIIALLSGSYTVKVKSYYGCTVITQALAYSVPRLICPQGNISLTSNITGSIYQWQRDDGTGFINISENSFYSGTNTAVLLLSNIPSTWYGYKFRCNTNMGTSNIFALQFTNYWTGTVNSVWENPANWSCGNLPDANTDVVINNGDILINSNVTIRRLTLNPVANLTVQTGNTLTITH